MKKTAVKLKHTDFNMKEHGFVGHLADQRQSSHCDYGRRAEPSSGH